MALSTRKILSSNELDGLLSAQGYVVIPFLNAGEVDRLNACYRDFHPNPVTGFYASSHVPDPEFRNGVNQQLREVIAPVAARHFDRGRVLGGTFVVKAQGDAGILQPHQDWTIVDESEHRSFNIWIPLNDVNANNGAVSILPGSHKQIRTYRGINLPNAFDGVRPLAWANMELLSMQAGQALIYDHRLVHGSGANRTALPRTAVVMGVVHEDTALRYYYNQGSEIGEYACSPSFYLMGKPAAGPADLPIVKTIEETPVQFNEEQFRRVFVPHAKNTSRWKGLLARIKQMTR